MARIKSFSRRRFLLTCGAASPFLPFAWAGNAPSNPLPSLLRLDPPGSATEDESFTFKPHYRSQSSLNSVLQKTDPANDAFPTEVIARELNAILRVWCQALMKSEAGWRIIAQSFNGRFRGSRLGAVKETVQRDSAGLRIWKRGFAPEIPLGPADFVAQLSRDPGGGRVLWAEFKLTSVESSGNQARTSVRYDLVESAKGYHRQQRTGWADLSWTKGAAGGWEVTEWRAQDEQCSRSTAPMFSEISRELLGSNESFRDQLAKGTDYWRSILDGVCGIDIYGNYGVAAGDFDNDGWDDLYICQPAGLPNRLYRNRGDGTFEDVTERAGVGVIDSSPMALFVDLNNDGLQDLLVVAGGGPLLFVNQGDGSFRLNEKAFHFASEAQGTFTGAAVADYDGDGWLDIYFCVYSYYQGLSRYRYPVPYDNARNGPPNFLFRNNRDGSFSDVTQESGLDRNNNRFSFACGWCDYDGDGWPDLYVANDFGQKNLYHNNGDGTFTDVAEKDGVLDTGAGMSVCWFDYDRDGRQDLYVADMWTAAGLRVTNLENFLPDAPADVRALYRKHSMGNSLFRNAGATKFEDETESSGTGVGRWAWSSDAWDFDCDGFEDLYIANGMISGPETMDLSSFFWRQVVARSPLGNRPTDAYEAGWNAINELIRSDGTWSGYERNVLYVNNGDGTFADVSGAAGLDAIDDSRSFALADIDHDGRQELILKNRTGPQLRVYRNIIADLGGRVSFKLRGRKGAPDAIGATLTVWTEAGRQTKMLRTGSGFLAQHSKEIFFGLGPQAKMVRVRVRWPSGAVQDFPEMPAGHRIEITEGESRFKAEPFASGSAGRADGRAEEGDGGQKISDQPVRGSNWLPSVYEVWLAAPISAPDFSLPDLSGHTHTLSAYRGRPLLLNFWETAGARSREQLRAFQHLAHDGPGFSILALNVNEPRDAASVEEFSKRERLRFPILTASSEVTAIYNLLYRYTFDRRRNLNFPISFLLDTEGEIVKIYAGFVEATKVFADAHHLPKSPEERLRRALPFRGDYYGGPLKRNYFTYGVAFAQHGYPEAAEAAFKRAIQEEPRSADAYYDLGTLYMQKGEWEQAETMLQKAVQLKPDNLMGFNNLGVISARQDQLQEAERYFQRALEVDPDNALAINNLADLYQKQGRVPKAQQLLENALQRQPDNPELNYKMGMILARMGRSGEAQTYLEKTVRLEPGNPEALDNLGVIYVMTGQVARAGATFQQCIERAPKFDQAYLNLARLDVKLGKREAAAEVLKLLLKQVPNHPSAKRYLQELER